MPKPLSKAAQEMRRQLSPAVMNQSQLAEQIGVSAQAVSNWLNGRARPEPESMVAIERLLGIPMKDWVQSAPDSGPEVVDDDESLHARAV